MVYPIFIFYVSANPLMMEYQLTFVWYCISAAILSETQATPLGSMLWVRSRYAYSAARAAICRL